MSRKFDRSLIPSEPDFQFEQELWNAGLRFVAGVDEAGRGALAGPVAAAAVIFPANPSLAHFLVGVRDSKQMTALQREKWAARLPELALGYGIGFASVEEIDRLGILAATRLAVQRAVDLLPQLPQHLLVDYLSLPGCPIAQTPLVKGDARSLSIAAASVFAKTARDALLCQLDQHFTGYGFAAHKGYGTPAHIQAITRLGLSEVHRRSFVVRKLIPARNNSAEAVYD
jgi:ribonuclease HII